jgi:hypothetical protein
MNVFNTGRHYTAKGQRIAVELLRYDPETLIGVIALADADRGIQGIYQVVSVYENECTAERAVMRAYDENARCPSGLAWHAESELLDTLRDAAHNFA